MKREKLGYRLLQPTYLARDGTRRGASKWYVVFRDQREIERKWPAFTSRKASDETGRNLVALVSYHRASGGQLDPALGEWLGALPQRTRDLLVKVGLLSRERGSVGKLLAEHLDDWHAGLLARGITQKQADQQKSRAERLLTACKATRLADVTADRVLAAAADLRAGSGGRRPVSERTSNFYVGAVQAFMRWALRDRRLSVNPLAGLETLSVTDARARRALTADETAWLIDVVGNGAGQAAPMERFTMSGSERALIYRVALGSGLRAGELASLTRASFDLDGNPPTIALPGSATKNRKAAVQPITRELADALRSHLAGKLPTVRAFATPPAWRPADMFRTDLDAARTAWVRAGATDAERGERDNADFLKPETDQGVAVFHSLRHTYGSDLARAGTPVKVAMDLMRHGDVNLTMRLYSHTVIADRAKALTALPDPSRLVQQRAKATGTDNASATLPDSADKRTHNSNVLADCLALLGTRYTLPLDSAGRSDGAGQDSQTPESTEKNAVFSGKSATHRAGFEPATFGSVDRCSIQLS